MYDSYLGARTGPSSDDVAMLQALYGTRLPDQYEGRNGNEKLSTASSINVGQEGGSLVAADLTTTGDVDVYKIKTDLSNFTVALRTSGLSLLTARVTVYDSHGNPLASAASTDPLQSDVTLLVAAPSRSSTYYVKVEKAGTDFSVGNYRLAVGKDAVLAVGTSSDSPFLNRDKHRDDQQHRATVLSQTETVASSRIDYSYRASLHDTTDVDFYKVTAPASSGGAPMSLVATVWGLETGKLDPRVTVYDSRGNGLQAEVIRDGDSAITVQVNGVAAGATYFVKVEAARSDSNNVGNYGLSLDFRADPLRVETFVSGTLSAAQTQDFRTLQVNESQLFLFQLSARNLETTTLETAVRMTVYDAAGQAVFTLRAAADQTVSADVLLDAGTYTVRFVAATRTGELLPLVQFDFRGLARSDSDGPTLLDPTAIPTGSTTPTSTPKPSTPPATPPAPTPTPAPTPAPPWTTSYRGGSFAFTPLPLDYLSFTSLTLTDPFSTPWW